VLSRPKKSWLFTFFSGIGLYLMRVKNQKRLLRNIKFRNSPVSMNYGSQKTKLQSWITVAEGEMLTVPGLPLGPAPIDCGALSPCVA
jgi:hypothetical protein